MGSHDDMTEDGSNEPEAADVHLDDVADVGPEAEVAASLKAALEALRTSADRVGTVSGEDAVTAAEDVAEQAAELDEQLGAIARKDDG